MCGFVDQRHIPYISVIFATSLYRRPPNFEKNLRNQKKIQFFSKYFFFEILDTIAHLVFRQYGSTRVYFLKNMLVKCNILQNYFPFIPKNLPINEFLWTLLNVFPSTYQIREQELRNHYNNFLYVQTQGCIGSLAALKGQPSICASFRPHSFIQ